MLTLIFSVQISQTCKLVVQKLNAGALFSSYNITINVICVKFKFLHNSFSNSFSKLFMVSINEHTVKMSNTPKSSDIFTEEVLQDTVLFLSNAQYCIHIFEIM